MPSKVVMTGIWAVSANCFSSSLAPEVMTPLPAIISGRWDSLMSLAAFLSWVGCPRVGIL
jgi:hypothetical protein